MIPKLVHARHAKMMLASVNKTDRLDARGMNRLQRSGTLPTVWIPSAELRDQRELFRTRMVFTQQRTRLKNRIHATLAKYALRIEESSDAFNKKGREELTLCLVKLPLHTRYAAERLLEQLDSVTDPNRPTSPTVRLGQLRSDVNRYLKWTFIEAAERDRVESSSMAHAIGAVARHLAESTYWMLKRGEEYREQKEARFRPRGGKRDQLLSSLKLNL